MLCEDEECAEAEGGPDLDELVLWLAWLARDCACECEWESGGGIDGPASKWFDGPASTTWLIIDMRYSGFRVRSIWDGVGENGGGTGSYLAAGRMCAFVNFGCWKGDIGA